MSGLIRSNSERASAVRPVTPDLRPGFQPLMIDPLALECDRLADEVARLQDTLAEMTRRETTAAADLEAARVQARREGHEAGRKEGLAQGTANLERLEGGIREARADFGQQLGAVERLAAALAEVTLDRILGSETDRNDTIIRTLRNAMMRLGEQTVVRVLVSSHDFPDSAELTRVKAGLASGAPEIDILVAPDLGPGQCRFVMHLGEAEVGPAQQWRVIAAELARQAGEVE